jgi:hypothetical protein
VSITKVVGRTLHGKSGIFPVGLIFMVSTIPVGAAAIAHPSAAILLALSLTFSRLVIEAPSSRLLLFLVYILV